MYDTETVLLLIEVLVFWITGHGHRICYIATASLPI